MMVCDCSAGLRGSNFLKFELALDVSFVRPNKSKGFEQIGGISVIAVNGPENSRWNDDVPVLEQRLTSELPKNKPFDHKAGSCYATLPRLLSHIRGNDREHYYLVTGDVFGILEAVFLVCCGAGGDLTAPY